MPGCASPPLSFLTTATSKAKLAQARQGSPVPVPGEVAKNGNPNEARTHHFMKMTLEQHRQFGEDLKQFRKTMTQKHITCVGKRASRESRAVENALKYLDRLGNAMDSVACRYFYEVKDVTRIYYGNV